MTNLTPPQRKAILQAMANVIGRREGANVFSSGYFCDLKNKYVTYEYIDVEKHVELIDDDIFDFLSRALEILEVVPKEKYKKACEELDKINCPNGEWWFAHDVEALLPDGEEK